jgi:formylglycine-generating enzyme required for sulfatase activity
VGAKAPNELGIYDMSGNMWELLSDWMEDYSPDDKINPTGPATGNDRMGRGGYWGMRPFPVYDRANSRPGQSSYNTGFRLVLPP